MCLLTEIFHFFEGKIKVVKILHAFPAKFCDTQNKYWRRKIIFLFILFTENFGNSLFSHAMERFICDEAFHLGTFFIWKFLEGFSKVAAKKNKLCTLFTFITHDHFLSGNFQHCFVFVFLEISSTFFLSQHFTHIFTPPWLLCDSKKKIYTQFSLWKQFLSGCLLRIPSSMSILLDLRNKGLWFYVRRKFSFIFRAHALCGSWSI